MSAEMDSGLYTTTGNRQHTVCLQGRCGRGYGPPSAQHLWPLAYAVPRGCRSTASRMNQDRETSGEWGIENTVIIDQIGSIELGIIRKLPN